MYLTNNTTALHHNSTPHITQETTDCQKDGVLVEKIISFN
jgi:hypothetical protein